MLKKGLISTILFVIMLTGCSQPQTTTTTTTITPTVSEPSSTTKTDTNILTLVTLDNFAPASYVDNGQTKGISVDIAIEALRRAGYAAKVEVYPWARCTDMVKNGEADALIGAYDTPARREFAYFPNESIITATMALFVRKDSDIAFDGTVANFKLPIGFTRGYAGGAKWDSAVKDKHITVDLSETIEATIQKLLDRRGIEAIYNSEDAIKATLKKMGKTPEVKELRPEIDKLQGYLIFSKQNVSKDVVTKFDTALVAMKQDGTYEKIASKYRQQFCQ